MPQLPLFLLAKALGRYLNLMVWLNPKKATALAYRYFSSPRFGKLAEPLPDFLASAKREMLELQGEYFPAYLWPGGTETILLLHGWESNSSRWQLLLPYLQGSGKTVVAIDAPAHGLSSGKDFNVPAYAAFADVAVKRFHPKYLLGHSMGGISALYYLKTYTHEIEKAVVLGSPSEMQSITKNYHKRLGLSKRAIGLLDGYFAERFGVHPRDFSGAQFATQISAKGFVGHDEEDDIVAFSEGEAIAKAWKAPLFRTTAAGHRLHDDALYKEIQKFLLDVTPTT